jgi:hypothetical protein
MSHGYIEGYRKAAGLVAQRVLVQGTLDNDSQGHSLKKLWQRLMPKLKKLKPDEEDFLLCIDEAVSLVSELDDSSQEFRYTQKREDGNQFRPSLRARTLDLGTLNATCEAAAENLQCINDWIKVEVDMYLEFRYYTEGGESLDQQ